jgi:predicted dehydrogenase
MNPLATRREFLAAAAAVSATAAVQVETARGFQANDTIRVGCIGTGGRCRQLMQALAKVPNVQLAAVCDVWDYHLAEGQKLAAPNAFVEKDYRKLLDRSDLDAVLIGTPDHQHVPITVAACHAQKDVYVEKPLTHEISEGTLVVEAEQSSKRIVQVGMQQRSMPHIAEARELIGSGLIGPVVKVHLTWNRNTPRARANKLGVDPASVDWPAFLGSAPAQPFDEYRFRNWRWFWDFGGGIFTDLMVHWIDVAHWVLGLDDPLSATSIGDFNHAGGLWETPDTVQTLLRYPIPTAPVGDPESTGVQAYFEGGFSNARHGAMITFMGTEASLYVDRGGYEVIPERRSKVAARQNWVSEGARGADFYPLPDGELLHVTNWIDCIRTRQTPNAPAAAGVQAAAAAHLANRALRSLAVATAPTPP